MIGLKKSQIKGLERVYRRTIPPDQILTQELSRTLARLSSEIDRQIGILVNRQGRVEYVVVGDAHQIVLPDFGRIRAGERRFRGLRLIHTHLNKEPISRDDLTDLALLRFDLVAAVDVTDGGYPGETKIAHLLPDNSEEKPWEILPPFPPGRLKINFKEFIASLEEEFARGDRAREVKGAGERVILVGVTLGSRRGAADSMEELVELARTSGADVLETTIQKRERIDPKYLMGKGKLQELIIRSMQLGAETLIFDRELSPSQARHIQEITELKIIDRTQLILDIFAQHAKSREGKVKVEIARLKYQLPRISERQRELSRLTGGIGARGPGETKLQEHFRRVRDRIARLKKELERISGSRKQRRSLRNKLGLPILSIIGYTNAGKSTLLNTLTRSDVIVADRLFATLDPHSRRLRFPKERDVIITDTVGFIRDLPKDLLEAFRATLEEMSEADLLLHVIDVSNPRFRQQIESVEELLIDLKLNHIPQVKIFNKIDKVDAAFLERINAAGEAVPISAVDDSTLEPLLREIEKRIWEDVDDASREYGDKVLEKANPGK